MGSTTISRVLIFQMTDDKICVFQRSSAANLPLVFSVSSVSPCLRGRFCTKEFVFTRASKVICGTRAGGEPMGFRGGLFCVVLALSSLAMAQATKKAASPATSPAKSALTALLEANIKGEWDAFQKKDKKAYSDLLADDFVAVEDDGQGMRTKNTAAGEIDRSVIDKYYLFALKVIPLNPD